MRTHRTHTSCNLTTSLKVGAAKLTIQWGILVTLANNQLKCRCSNTTRASFLNTFPKSGASRELERNPLAEGIMQLLTTSEAMQQYKFESRKGCSGCCSAPSSRACTSFSTQVSITGFMPITYDLENSFEIAARRFRCSWVPEVANVDFVMPAKLKYQGSFSSLGVVV